MLEYAYSKTMIAVEVVAGLDALTEEGRSTDTVPDRERRYSRVKLVADSGSASVRGESKAHARTSRHYERMR